MTAAPTLSLSTIGQIAVVVSDVDRSTAFYRDTLGMRFLFAFPGLAFFDCDGVRLMLTRPQADHQPSAGSVVYFRVPDIQQASTTLRERGVAFDDDPHVIARMPDHDLWMTFFRDPDGHLYGLMEERRRADQAPR